MVSVVSRWQATTLVTIARRKACKHAVRMVIAMAAVVASRIRIRPFVALQFVSVAIQEMLRPVRAGHV